MNWNREKAYQFLQQSWARAPYVSLMSRDKSFKEPMPQDAEIYSSSWILLLLSRHLPEALKREMLDRIEHQYLDDNRISYFVDRALLAPDVDSTARGVTLLTEARRISPERGRDSVDQMLANTTRAGVIHTFFNERPIIDLVACANALYTIYLYDRERDAAPTEEFLIAMLDESDANILRQCPFYCSVDTFMLHVARLVARFERSRGRLLEPLRAKFEQRLDHEYSLLEAAQRALIAGVLGTDRSRELGFVAGSQLANGSWGAEALYRDFNHLYGSPELSTAFALAALEDAAAVVTR